EPLEGEAHPPELQDGTLGELGFPHPRAVDPSPVAATQVLDPRTPTRLDECLAVEPRDGAIPDLDLVRLVRPDLQAVRSPGEAVSRRGTVETAKPEALDSGGMSVDQLHRARVRGLVVLGLVPLVGVIGIWRRHGSGASLPLARASH